MTLANYVRSGLLVFAVSWVVLFWQLGHAGLMDDEAHYARLTQEMAAEGNWLVPRLNGVAFIDKPVFFHWVQGTANALVTRGELAARLPSAVAAVALLLGLALFAVRLIGPAAGRGAWLSLASVPATLVLGRTGYMDMLFTALLFGAVALMTTAMLTSSRRARVGAIVCIALAVLTKGPIAAGLIGLWVGGLWMLGGQSRRAVARLHLWPNVFIVALLASPWFLWMFWQFGEQFVGGYVGAGHVGYLTPRNSASSSQWSFYVRMFLTAFFPWSLIAVGYGLDSIRRWWAGASIPAWEIWLWMWIVVVLAVFTLVPFRVDRYIYPAAPACCVLAVRGWMLASAAPHWRDYAITRGAAGVVALIFIAGGAFLWVSLPGLNLPLTKAAGVLPALLVIGGVLIAAKMLRRGLPMAPVEWPAMTLVAAYACVVFFAVPALRTGLPIEQVGRFVADNSEPDEPVAILGIDRWQMGLTYYLHTPPTQLSTVTEAEQFAKAPGRRTIVTRRRWRDQLTTGGCVTFSVPAIVGTKGRGLRTQVWGEIVVIQFDSGTAYSPTTCPP